jgi:hypothetical protein
MHALSGIRTHDPSNQPAKTYTSYRTATVTGLAIFIIIIIIIMIINGDTAQSRALASLTGFVSGILRCGLSVPRSTWF